MRERADRDELYAGGRDVPDRLKAHAAARLECGPARDPRGPADGNGRTLRGGAWNSDASLARAAFRGGTIGVYLSGALGFRLARAALAPAQ